MSPNTYLGRTQSVQVKGLVLLSFLLDVSMFGDRLFATLASKCSDVRVVSRSECGSKLLIG